MSSFRSPRPSVPSHAPLCSAPAGVAPAERAAPDLTGQLIGAAIEVHRHLGPGLLEGAYQQALAHELSLRSIPFEREVPFPVTYKGRTFDCGFRLDLLVAGALVVEIKAVAALLPVHEAQLLTYMKLGGFRVGLLVNFHARLLRNGIVRRVL